ncbi:hypothetical protein [Halonotius pteroides]|uniref:hypothetical protein n=1 Tax=Halonotius pteroides TaxID=268735 RepID=UPI001058FBF0|nr:hypothetical protein [Halonotius pteroides]
MSQESEEDYRVGKSTITNIEFGPPKFLSAIPQRARRTLDATTEDLEYEQGEEVEKVVVQAELTVTEVYTKDL